MQTKQQQKLIELIESNRTDKKLKEKYKILRTLYWVTEISEDFNWALAMLLLITGHWIAMWVIFVLMTLSTILSAGGGRVKVMRELEKELGLQQ